MERIDFMLKILHTADWHIGNFPGPNTKDGTNARFNDICSYIEFLIQKATTDKPDVIIIAGDTFNQAKTWSDRGLKEAETVIKYLNQLANIAPVCVLRGTPNHDGKTHFELLKTAFVTDDNTHDVIIIDEPCVKNIENKAAIAFVPIFDKGLYRAEASEILDKEAECNFFCDKVRDAILDLKIEADKYNLPTILITHYTVLGSTMPNGQINIMATNETVIDPMTLNQADYNLVCLGHIHKAQALDTCINAFYSGSLCALNFNDENGIHGFYMHVLDDAGTLSSEFIRTPSRAFQTLYFDDAQLDDIITRDYDLNAYFTANNYVIGNYYENNIIRVIYTCTDVTNKRLNKAQLEKALYNTTNAFYIQEITPADIIITVDKTVMQNSNDATSNLRTFLLNEQREHNSISDTQINDCLLLAQPIIDEITANQITNQTAGVFTPIEIEVKNYRNYREAVFNYNDVRFCVINGENGAGKSSLFMDAMSDALFEETREGEITGWINNDNAIRSGSIKFTFSIGNVIYKITRTRQKSGKATLNLAMLGTDENNNKTWVDLSEEKMKDTQTVINQLIGMNAMTLKSCGLIMQDAYGLFLKADKTTRMSILGDILGLDFYETLNNAASEIKQICQREINNATEKQNNIMANMKNGENIQQNLNQAQTDAKTYANDMKDCNNLLLINTTKHSSFMKDIDMHNVLNNEIATLNQKKQAANDAVSACKAEIEKCDIIIATENDVIAKHNRYKELLAVEKDMIEKTAQISAKTNIRMKLENDINMYNTIIADADTKINVLTQQKYAIEIELSTADDIAAKAALYEKTKQELADAEKTSSKIRDLESHKTAKQNTINSINEEHRNLDANHNIVLNDIKKKETMIAESGCPLVESKTACTCRFLIDAQKTVESKDNIIADYNSQVQLINIKINAKITEINDITDEITKLTASLPDINLKKQELAVYENAAFKMASIPEQKKLVETYAQQIIDFDNIKSENSTKLADAINQFNENTHVISQLTTAVLDFDKIKAEIASLANINDLNNQIVASKANKANAEKRIAELTNEIQLIDFDIFDKARARSQLNIDTVAVNELNANIIACQARQDLLSKNIAENGKLIGQLENELRQYKDDIRQLDTLRQHIDKSAYMASNCDWLKKAFSKKGIPHNIIRSIIPLLETTASNILNQMSNNTMSIELRTEKTLTTKKEVASLDVIVCDNVTGDLPYLSRSGGERVKASLSVVLALAEIKASKNGIQLGFLFIDEPPFLDAPGIDAYCDALEAIQNRYANLKIMAITHDPAMKSRFNQSIDIIKGSNGSEIVTNL